MLRVVQGGMLSHGAAQRVCKQGTSELLNHMWIEPPLQAMVRWQKHTRKAVLHVLLIQYNTGRSGWEAYPWLLGNGCPLLKTAEVCGSVQDGLCSSSSHPQHPGEAVHHPGSTPRLLRKDAAGYPWDLFRPDLPRRSATCFKRSALAGLLPWLWRLSLGPAASSSREGSTVPEGFHLGKWKTISSSWQESAMVVGEKNYDLII